MQETRFDDFTKSIASWHTARRSFLKLLAGTITTSLLGTALTEIVFAPSAMAGTGCIVDNQCLKSQASCWTTILTDTAVCAACGSGISSLVKGTGCLKCAGTGDGLAACMRKAYTNCCHCPPATTGCNSPNSTALQCCAPSEECVPSFGCLPKCPDCTQRGTDGICVTTCTSTEHCQNGRCEKICQNVQCAPGYGPDPKSACACVPCPPSRGCTQADRVFCQVNPEDYRVIVYCCPDQQCVKAVPGLYPPYCADMCPA